MSDTEEVVAAPAPEEEEAVEEEVAEQEPAAEEEEAPAAEEKPPKKKKAKKVVEPEGPIVKQPRGKYGDMINAAIKALKQRNGASRQAIYKWVVAHYEIGDDKQSSGLLKQALKRGVANGTLTQTKGVGASGSFKIVKPDNPSGHPKYADMIGEAITDLREHNGSSRQAILAYVVENYKVKGEDKLVAMLLKQALKRGVKSGFLKQTKGVGASGRFKLTKPMKKKKPAPAPAPVAKKPSPKKAKKAAKPAAKKAAKPAAKKAAARKGRRK